MLQWFKRIGTDAHLLLSTVGTLLMGWLSFWPDSALLLWNQMPYDVKTKMPAGLVSGLGLIIFGLSALARLLPRKK